MASVTSDDRQAAIRREKGRGVVRAIHSAELEEAGKARADALREAERQLDRIAKALPDALAAGLSVAEISRMTGVSRPTLYELQHRYGNGGNLWLGVMQIVANRGKATGADVTAILGKRKAVGEMLSSLIEQGLLAEDFNDDPDEPAMEYWLTDSGFSALEHFDRQEQERDE